MPPLTKRELETVRLIAVGKCNKEAASEMHISVKTIEKHRSNASQKIGVSHVVGLVHWAIRSNIVQVQQFGRDL